ncbi:acyl-CoA thioesterase [Tenacibaculum agarivorans]|uniref:acyl-CoA thioesterase n=1 Tax=Tenacibaculum agarivorans TaxID=1908389 RepID=UPI00094BB77B|nr:thioesterase family protein [Tenacibaculum agarivorans]
MNSDKVFSTTRTVVSSEIDDLDHVNNVVYLQWVQDIATLHWQHLTKNSDAKDLIWVVLRHEIDYLGQATLNEKITLKTWVGETKGVKSIRHVEIFKEDKLLVKAQTTWCLLNNKTLRPTRITEDIFNLLSPA